MTNTQRVVDYILSNVGKLKPEKIEALSKLVASLSGEVEKGDNKVPESPNSQDMLTDQPVNMSDVTGFQIDDGDTKKVKIYGN